MSDITRCLSSSDSPHLVWSFLVGSMLLQMALFDSLSWLRSIPWGFPGGSVVKNPAANAGDVGSIPGSGRSLEEAWQPTPVFLPGEPRGQRSLAGCRPRGCRESDMTERLNGSMRVCRVCTRPPPFVSEGVFAVLPSHRSPEVPSSSVNMYWVPSLRPGTVLSTLKAFLVESGSFCFCGCVGVYYMDVLSFV